MSTFRWGVIGAGRIANKVMSEITEYENHELGGVYSRTFAHAKQLTDKVGGIAYDNLHELLSSPHIDGIYIATPHSEHYNYMLKCIEYNKPFLCEKSLAVNAAQAEHALNLASQKGVYGQEAMWTRFSPVVSDILDIVDNGDLGEIISFKADFSVPRQLFKHTERIYSPELAGGALLDLGVYPVSYAQMLLGSPVALSSTTRMSKQGVDISNKIKLTMENGAICDLSCSFNKLGGVACKIEFEKGSIYTPLFYRPTQAKVKSKGKSYMIKGGAGYIYQFNKVADDIRLGKLESEEMSHADSCDVMHVLDSVRYNAKFSYPEQIEKLFTAE